MRTQVEQLRDFAADYDITTIVLSISSIGGDRVNAVAVQPFVRSIVIVRASKLVWRQA